MAGLSKSHKHNTEKSWELLVSSVRWLGTSHSQQLLTVSGILERPLHAKHTADKTDTVFGWEVLLTENEIPFNRTLLVQT